MKRKQILSVILSAVLVLGLVPGVAATADGTAGGQITTATISSYELKVSKTEKEVISRLKSLWKAGVDLKTGFLPQPPAANYAELQHEMDSGVKFFTENLTKPNQEALSTALTDAGMSYTKFMEEIDGMALDEIKLYVREHFGYVKGVTEYLNDIENLHEQLKEYERLRNDYYYLGEQYLDSLTEQERATRVASSLSAESVEEETSSVTQAEAAARGLEAIRATGWADILVLPKEESYLANWKTLYARKAFQAPNLRVERISRLRTGRLTMPYIYEGVAATVVAEENDMSCIIYRGNDNRLYAGWIQSIRLLDEFPGETYTVGTAPSVMSGVRDDITVDWSKEKWPGFPQNFSLLSEEVRNCVGFTLEYQLIAENTPNWDAILGPRKIYVRSDGEWLEVGEFPYPEFGAVKTTVYLPHAMNIDAIGTVAQCTLPNTFFFRQTATDFLLGG